MTATHGFARWFVLAILAIAPGVRADEPIVNRAHVTWTDAEGNPSAAAVAAESVVMLDDVPAIASIRATPSGTVLGNGAVIFTNTTGFRIAFDEPLQNPPGDDAPFDVTNPSSYRLVFAGPDAILETSSCAGAPGGDDSQTIFSSIVYDEATFVASASVDPLRRGNQRLILCSARLRDLGNNPLNGGGDPYVDFAVAGYADTPTLDPMALAILTLVLALAGWRVVRS